MSVVKNILKGDKLIKYYTQTLIDACYNFQPSLANYILNNHKEHIDWTYVNKLGQPLVEYLLLLCDIKLVKKCFDANVKDYSKFDFKDLLLSSASYSTVDIVKYILSKTETLGINKKSYSDYKYWLDFALRDAGENNNHEVFNHLLTVGAKPNQWHVVYVIAKKGDKQMFERLLSVLDINEANKKMVIKYCDNPATTSEKYNFINIDNLKTFLNENK